MEHDEITVLYEDEDVIAAVKPAGVLSEGTGMPAMLRSQCGEADIFCVHRLDKEASGIMVYAKNERAAADLSAKVSSKEMEKEYYAIVSGVPAAEGEMEDLLFHDRTKNKTYVVKRERKGVKKALLHYTLCRTLTLNNAPFSLVRIKLQTGRTHQIRVQFASRGMPLLGDRKYGGSPCGTMALFSCALKLRQPRSHRLLQWERQPAGEPWDTFFKESETE